MRFLTLRPMGRALACLLLASWFQPPAAAGGPEVSSALEYRSIGPAVAGRASRATGVPGDPLTFYVAFSQSGVWKSEDGGFGWKPIFDDQDVASIGSIAVAPSDPNVIYVGSGEANIRGNVVAGNGIYKSTDAGRTWKQVWSQIGQIGTMAVHPTNPDIAFAAVLGHAFGPNPERGVYRTTDGGATWKRVLAKDEWTGASDVAMDPSNPRILFAGLWQARRRPWEMTSGGPGSGLYRSADGGETWKQLTGNGLPEGLWGKVGVAVARSDGQRVYALIENENGGLYRSDDGGDTWILANGHHAIMQRAWYYSVLTIDPKNPDVVWIPQVPMLRSIDGGKTVHNVDGFHHGDHHDLWIDSTDTRRMVVAHDGGVEVSHDGGKSWYFPPLPTGQFYNIDADNRLPYHVGGTMQDEGTASGPSNSLKGEGIALGEWRTAGGGEAGDFVYGLDEPGQIYAGEYGGIITHYDESTGQAKNVCIYPTNPSGHGAEDLRVRFQWTAPIAVSPHDPKALYHGANVLYRSHDRGQTWTAISPDLTRNDKSKQKWSGGPITGDNTGVEIYNTLFSLAISPLEPGLIWAGSDDGLVHVTRDDGATWANVTPPGMPEWGTVESIEASRFAAGTAYVVVDNHRMDDYRPYLWKTTDYGKTWKGLISNLPTDVPLLVVKEDGVLADLLFLGTEKSIWFTRDGGRSWEALKLNLPAVSVTDLVVKGNDLVVGTRGRSIWILDDFSPLRTYTAGNTEPKLQLLAPQPARRWRRTSSWSAEGAAKNPPYGAILHYAFKEQVEGEATLEILDRQGRTVRRLSSIAAPQEFPEDDPDEPQAPPKAELSTAAGLHRVVWDLDYSGADRLENAKVDLGNPREGPAAPPGTYTLRLTVGGQVSEATLELLPDPRTKVSAADLAAQLEFGLEVRAALNRNIAAIRKVRSIREQAGNLEAQLAGRSDAAELKAKIDSAVKRCDALEAKLHNPKAKVVYDILAQRGGTQLYSNLAFVYETAKWGDGAPTQGAREVFAELLTLLASYEAELSGLEGTDVRAIEELSSALAVPRIVTSP